MRCVRVAALGVLGLVLCAPAGAIEIQRVSYNARTFSFDVSGKDAQCISGEACVAICRYSCPLVNNGTLVPDWNCGPVGDGMPGSGDTSVLLDEVDARKSGAFRFRTRRFSSRNPVPCLVHVVDDTGSSAVVKVEGAPFYCDNAFPPPEPAMPADAFCQP